MLCFQNPVLCDRDLDLRPADPESLVARDLPDSRDVPDRTAKTETMGHPADQETLVNGELPETTAARDNRDNLVLPERPVLATTALRPGLRPAIRTTESGDYSLSEPNSWSLGTTDRLYLLPTPKIFLVMLSVSICKEYFLRFKCERSV